MSGTIEKDVGPAGGGLGPRRALVTGATGFIGGRLASSLAERGWEVRCLVRDRDRAAHLAQAGMDLHEGDVLDAVSLRGAGEGVVVAYYLVHAMGRGGTGDFEELERRAARNFAEMARREGIPRVVYLGGLGDRPQSKHLRSRHRTARMLAEHGPPLTYFRAGMVVGAGSESYRTLRYLVQRLPVMIGPAWLATPTQAIAIDDVISYLAQAPDVPESEGREVQIGGPDVVSYGDMLDRMAEALGIRTRPRLPVPFLTPWLSSLWIGLVTPVDAAVARPLIEGLATPTTVTDPSGAALFQVEPMSLTVALQKALAEDPEAPAMRGSGVRLLSREVRQLPPTGPLETVQRAELLPAPDGSITADRELLELAGNAYWRFLSRRFLGLVRVVSDRDGQAVVLLVRSFVLLRFRAPRYEELDRGCSVTWPIVDGLLVSREGRGRGFLRLSIERADSSEASAGPSLTVTMEVKDFLPSIRASGRLAWLGTRVYALTQGHLHRVTTRRFLRSLARVDLSK
jgi:uncharacterized protein YbjT (DUF2867 family)